MRLPVPSIAGFVVVADNTATSQIVTSGAFDSQGIGTLRKDVLTPGKAYLCQLAHSMSVGAGFTPVLPHSHAPFEASTVRFVFSSLEPADCA